jgi:hypothetical protein
MMTEERKGGVAGSDSRIKKSRGSAKSRGDPMAAQAAEIQSEDGTAMTAEDRRRMIREEWQQNVLPRAPEIPGYHTCWLSTTNGADTIHRRLKVGYTLVKREEVLGFEAENVTSGSNQYAGYVTCNEMVLGKIPQEVYQATMEEFHHYGPMNEEAAIRERMKNQVGELNQEAGQAVIRTVGGGFDTLGTIGNPNQKGPPIFKG